jgi:hypothetical protein
MERENEQEENPLDDTMFGILAPGTPDFIFLSM